MAYVLIEDLKNQQWDLEPLADMVINFAIMDTGFKRYMQMKSDTIHAAETLETLLGRRVPKTALNNQAMWLSRELLNNDMHITFPGSHRMRFPQEPADRAVYNSTHTTQRPLHEGYHLES